MRTIATRSSLLNFLCWHLAPVAISSVQKGIIIVSTLGVSESRHAAELGLGSLTGPTPAQTLSDSSEFPADSVHFLHGT